MGQLMANFGTPIDEAFNEEHVYLGKILDFSNKLLYQKNNIDITDEDVSVFKNIYDPAVYIHETETYKNKLSEIFEVISLLKNKIQKQVEINTSTKQSYHQLKDLADTDDYIEYASNISQLATLLETQDNQLKGLHDSMNEKEKFFKYMITKGPHYTDNDARKLCPVCLNFEVNMAYVPCGHTICDKCYMKTTNCDSCIMCRNPTEKVMKLYFN
tara:strand:- start:86 stop:727 length:642 start_codon:yes stop_codon:yes gene_type:complete